ncbi:MAG: AraC family transcriptional regulator ligand-binding domain-containing protein [Myxococcota bacterium]
MSTNHGYSLDPGFKSLLASVGVRHQEVLRRAGLPEDVLSREDVRVSAEQYFAFTHVIARVIDDPVRLVTSVSAESFSPPVFAALCSPNLTVAIARLARFKPLIAPIRLRTETSAAGFQVTFDWPDCALGPSPFLLGSEALFLVKLARMGTRHEVCATAVTLPELPRQRQACEAFLGCSIQRGEILSVSFSPEDAERPFLTDNSAMWNIFEPQLRQRLSELEGSASIKERTRAVLLEALPSGQVSTDVVARRLAVSARTLQRRLRAEGTSFKAVVDETRKSLSLYYLEQTQLSHTEIAYLIGFEEPNSFFRAFRSWTGTTPESLRQSRQNGA